MLDLFSESQSSSLLPNMAPERISDTIEAEVLEPEHADLDLGLTLYSPLEALFNEYDVSANGIREIATFVADKTGLIRHFTMGNRDRGGMSSFTAEIMFREEGALKSLDAEFWSRCLNLTDVLECMPAKTRNQWHEEIHECRTPTFSRECVIPTVQSLLMSRQMFLAEKVDGLFRALSGNHVTNGSWGFRTRMIVERMLDSYGYPSHQTCEYLQDLRQVIAKLMGRSELSTRSSYWLISRLHSEQRFGEWVDFDGGALKVKLFKKGTSHFEVHPEIAARLNGILAYLHPNAIPSDARKKPSKPPKDHQLYHDFLSGKVLDVLAEMAHHRDNVVFTIPFEASKDKGLMEQVDRIMRLAGGIAKSHGIWDFGYCASPVLSEIVRQGRVPDTISFQWFPTPEELGRKLVDQLWIEADDVIVEPEAGTGELAELLPKDQTMCVEISEIRAKVLEAKGFRVVCTDFLTWQPEVKPTKIAMNPPFSNGRAADHVRHAASILQDGPRSRLAAILPASMMNSTPFEGWHHEWFPIKEAGFEGTGVHVCLLVLSRS